MVKLNAITSIVSRCEGQPQPIFKKNVEMSRNKLNKYVDMKFEKWFYNFFVYYPRNKKNRPLQCRKQATRQTLQHYYNNINIGETRDGCNI